MRIDAHLHFWKPSCGFDNRPVADHPAYRHDFLPQTVAPAMAEAGIDAALLVQTCPQVEETRWLVDLARDDPRIVGITGWVDLDAPDVDLDALLALPKVVGLRAQLRRIADDAFVERPNVVRHLAAALDAGLGVTMLAEERHHVHVLRVLDRLPDGPVTLNHLGMPTPSGDRARWRTHLAHYARRPSTFLQFSGLPFLFGERWREPDAQAVLDDAYDAFGPSRLLFASDWPMLTRFASYVDWVRAVEAFLDRRGATRPEREAIFGGNLPAANPRLGSTVPAIVR